MKNIFHISKFIPFKITEYPTEKDILKSVIKCTDETTARDEDGNEEEIVSSQKEEMLKAFDTIRRGLQFYENVIEKLFG